MGCRPARLPLGVPVAALHVILFVSVRVCVFACTGMSRDQLPAGTAGRRTARAAAGERSQPRTADVGVHIPTRGGGGQRWAGP